MSDILLLRMALVVVKACAFMTMRAFIMALCQMLGCSPYEPSLAPIICMVGAILFAQK